MTAEMGGKLVIVNLQGTPFDYLASLRIWGRVDDVVERLMGKLEIPIPPFKLRRYLSLSYNSGNDPTALVITGLDSDGSPYDIFKSTHSSSPNQFTLEFHGNYLEPKLSFEIDQRIYEDVIKL